MALNKVMLIGNTGKDPVVRHLENGNVTASVSLATSEKYKDKNGQLQTHTEWHNIVCWRNLAEFMEKYIKKGMQLYVEGKIRSGSYTDKDGITRYNTDIVADSIRLLDRKSDSPAQQQMPQQQTQPVQAQTVQTNTTPQNSEDLPSDDDLPF